MGRYLEWIATLAIATVAAYLLVSQVVEIAARWSEVQVAADFIVVRDAADRWLHGGPFYLPLQLAGPYEWPGPYVLYPPVALFLFIPFVYLPNILWWVVPIGITAWVVWSHHPRPLAWAVILLICANPTTISMVVWGNPGLWIVAALALGTRYGWPSVLMLLKPTLAPFALFGIWRRSWWIALLACALLSLPFLPMWFDYVTALRNAHHASALGIGEFGYSIAQAPAMFLPIVAWLGRRWSPYSPIRNPPKTVSVYGVFPPTVDEPGAPPSLSQ